MGQKIRKISRWASKAVIKTSDKEREEVRRFYAMLDAKARPAPLDPIEEYIEGEEGEIELGDLLEGLHSSSDDIVVEALKKMGCLADRGMDTGKALPFVTGLLEGHPTASVRYEATRVITKARGRGAEDALVRVIKNDRSEKVREGAVRALGFIRAERRFNLIASLLNDVWEQPQGIRKAAAFALSRLDCKAVADVLCGSLIRDPDAEVRREVAESIAVCLLKLEKNEAQLVAKSISSQLNPEVEPSHEVRVALINAVAVVEDINRIDDLIISLKSDPHPRVRGQAANALAHFFDPKIEKVLIESLESETGGAKKRVALALAHYALRNPLGLHDDVCDALIYIQKHFPRGSYVWKEAVKALPAC